jgi:hypothetical protein
VVTVEAQKQRKLIERQVSRFVSSITLPGKEESLGLETTDLFPRIGIAPVPRVNSSWHVSRRLRRPPQPRSLRKRVNLTFSS